MFAILLAPASSGSLGSIAVFAGIGVLAVGGFLWLALSSKDEEDAE